MNITTGRIVGLELIILPERADRSQADRRGAPAAVARGVAGAGVDGTSRYALRELRAQSGGRPLRVFYIFDPRRDAVLLIGGDKTGDGRFYERLIPVAERLWESFQKEQGFK